MSTMKKRALLRHALETVREAGRLIELPYDHEDDYQYCIVCYIQRVNVFKQCR